MSEADRLLAAVKADPTDALLRLVLADALDDEGAYRAAAWLRLDEQLSEDIERTGFVDPRLLNDREVHAPAPWGVPSLHTARLWQRSASKRSSSRRRPRR